MKKSKLKISRTTIQQMSVSDLADVNGRGPTASCALNCTATGLQCPVTVNPINTVNRCSVLCPPPTTIGPAYTQDHC